MRTIAAKVDSMNESRQISDFDLGQRQDSAFNFVVVVDLVQA
jgi:hypothetical protein